MLRDVLHRLHAGSVQITPELRMLDEALGVDQRLEGFARREVVRFAIFFARSRRAGRVRDGEAEAVGVLFEEAVEQSRFAGSRGAGDDDGLVGLEG